MDTVLAGTVIAAEAKSAMFEMDVAVTVATTSFGGGLEGAS